MQLGFFGETFDPAKCKRTCDNCKAEREADERNLTSLAKEFLGLLKLVNDQKKVTLVQLTDLYRGSKSQSAVKFLDMNRLKKYCGAGSKFKKFEIDKIVHSLVFDRILIEKGEENKGGFNSDYVHMGENAWKIENGQEQFCVKFPKARSKPSGKEKTKAAAPKKTSTKAKKPPSAKKKKAAPSTTNSMATHSRKFPESLNIGDDDEDDDDDDDDDDLDTSAFARATGRTLPPSIIPQEAVQNMADRLKFLPFDHTAGSSTKVGGSHKVYCHTLGRGGTLFLLAYSVQRRHRDRRSTSTNDSGRPQCNRNAGREHCKRLR
jgi:hypothetical protein